MADLKILHVTHHFKPFTGGIEKVIDELCQRLLKQGDRASVLCLDRLPQNNGRLPRKEVIDGVEIKRLPFYDLKYYKVAPGILNEVRKSDADLVHIHNIGFLTDALLLAKLFGLLRKKVVVSTNGGVFHTDNLAWLKKVYFRLWLPLALNQAEKVIAISKNDFRLFSRIIRKEKLVLLEEGVDLDRFASLTGRKKNNSFLFVGRISRNKRIDRLLDVFAGLKGKARLTIVGRDSQGILPRLKGQAQDLALERSVSFAGAVSEKELLQAYGQAEFFVSASEFEGFGLSAIEAMAAGVIPVLNRIGTFSDFVSDKENGFIVDFSSHSKAAKAIEGIIGLPAKKKAEMAKKARQASRRFDWRNKIGEFNQVYRSAAGASP